MNKTRYLGLSAVVLFALPALTFAQTDNYGALLAQVPAPPTTMTAAAARWQPGKENSGSQAYFDKDANAVLAKLQTLQTGLQQQVSYGGQNVQEMQQKLASMNDQEKMAYGMQMAQAMAAAQRNAYTGASAQALMRSQQNDAQRVQKSLAVEKAARAMSDMEHDYQTRFDALDKRLHVQTSQCPEVKTGGDMMIHSPACTQPIVARYMTDYHALVQQQLAAYHQIYVQMKAATTADVAGWSADIAGLQGSGNEVAHNEVVRKQMMIYEEIKDLAIPADRAVNLGYEALQLTPDRACGSDCL